MKKKIVLFLLLTILVAAAVVAIVVNNKKQKDNVEVSEVNTPITISKQPILEEYYSGSSVLISGSGILARTARGYIDAQIKDFAAAASTEVPPMISQFGKGTPPATYTIELNAIIISGQVTTSIVIDSYLYRGGANGMSAYKVFTASNTTGKILPITDIIEQAKQDAFVSFVKNELLNKKDYGVFPEDVDALNINSFSNWSFDKEGNLTLYFDKYAIGPGALGAIAFPLSVEKIKTYLK